MWVLSLSPNYHYKLSAWVRTRNENSELESKLSLQTLSLSRKLSVWILSLSPNYHSKLSVWVQTTNENSELESQLSVETFSLSEKLSVGTSNLRPNYQCKLSLWIGIFHSGSNYQYMKYLEINFKPNLKKTNEKQPRRKRKGQEQKQGGAKSPPHESFHTLSCHRWSSGAFH